jgi:hypothetical protein
LTIDASPLSLTPMKILKEKPFKYEEGDIVLCQLSGHLNTSYARVLDRKRSRLTGRNLYHLRSCPPVYAAWRGEKALLERINF